MYLSAEEKGLIDLDGFGIGSDRNGQGQRSTEGGMFEDVNDARESGGPALDAHVELYWTEI